jgi:hypothetical protein
MPTTLEIINHRITLMLGTLALVGIGLGFMDARHASASDVQAVANIVQKLAETIQGDRIGELEYKIEDIESQISRAESLPVATRPEQHIKDLRNKKARYIRKLDRLLGDD